MTAAARRLIILLGACLTYVTLPHQAYAAQDKDLLSAPPKVNFDNWTPIVRGEFSSLYEQVIVSPVETPYAENNQIRLKVIIPETAPRPWPTVILLHFWGAAETRLEEDIAERLAARGIASVIFPLPYHLTRTPQGHRSGELAIQPDPDQLVMTMSQSVKDLRRTIDWIETRPELDAKRIGLGGTSLGSIIGTLAYAVEPRIAAASFLLGGVDLAHILWNSSRVVQQRDLLRSQGWTEEKLREALAPIEPANYLPNAPQRPTFVVGAKYDTVIPNRSTQDLISVLGDPPTLWLETGHYGGVLVQSRLITTVSSFFDATLHGREFTAPERLTAPTIRLGLNYTGEEGFQIAGGFDFWRRDDAFASFLITPTGPQAYLGYNLSKELSVGVSAGGRRATWGVFWSIIL